MNFILNLFTWNGRASRLYFWMVFLFSFITIFVFIGFSAFFSVSGYSDDAKKAKVIADARTIVSQIETGLVMGKFELNELVLENNELDFQKLGGYSYDFSDIKIFVEGDKYQVYGDALGEAVVKGNSTDPLVVIDGKTISHGDIIGDYKKGSSVESKVESMVTIFIVYYVFLTWVTLMTYVKRLHDLNKTGWFALISFIPLINLFLFLYLGFASGEKRANKYGLSLYGDSDSEPYIQVEKTENQNSEL